MSHALRYFTLFAFTLGFAVQAATLPAVLQVDSKRSLTSALSNVYGRYQSARNLSDPARLAQAVERVYGAEVALKIQSIYMTNPELYVKAREEALRTTPVKPNGKSIVVSGLSSSGVAAAFLAANAGFNVTGFEARAEYTRNIQWTARQSIIDSLALIDQGMSDRMRIQLARPISVATDLVDSLKQDHFAVGVPQRGNPTKVPDGAGEMLDGDTVMILQTKEFEKFMLSELRRLKNIDIRLKSTMIPERTADGLSIAGLGQPYLVVVAEGSGSKTRKLLGIANVPTSPARTQIAGDLNFERNGALTFNREQVVYADGEVDFLLTSAISKGASGRNWTVTDVPKNFSTEPSGLAPGTEEYATRKQNLVNDFYYGALAKVLQMPLSEIRKMEVAGPIEKTLPTVFQLQQNMSRTAVYASNAVAIGDTVGNAHWNVGGGVHIALISHIRRLSNLFFDLELGRNRNEALAEYDVQVKADSMEWGRRGIVDFYPNLDPATVRKNYDRSIQEWELSGNSEMTPAAKLAERLRGVPALALSCGKLFAH